MGKVAFWGLFEAYITKMTFVFDQNVQKVSNWDSKFSPKIILFRFSSQQSDESKQVPILVRFFWTPDRMVPVRNSEKLGSMERRALLSMQNQFFGLFSSKIEAVGMIFFTEYVS